MNLTRIVLSLFMTGILIGCGNQDEVEVATVTGQVTLDGQPLPEATLMFQPESGRPAIATTDSEGRYSLIYSEGVQGAIVGRNKVIIRSEIPGEDGEPPIAPEKLPKKYHDESTLSVDVTPGENVHDFKLTSS